MSSTCSTSNHLIIDDDILNFCTTTGHYEWQIRFAPGDVDMATVRAQLGSDGKLSIEVQRCLPGQTCSPCTGMGLRYRF